MSKQSQIKLTQKLLFLPTLLHFIGGSLILSILYSQLRSWESAITQIYSYGVVYLLFFSLFLLLFYLRELSLAGVGIKTLLGKPKFSDLCISVAVGLGLAICGIGWVKLVFPNFLFPKFDISLQIINWILSTVVGPICDELIFRGYARECFKPNDRKIKAIVVSSFAFALWHYHSPHVIFPAFIGGVIFYLLYLKTESLIAPILAHAIMNFTALIVIW